MGRNRDWSKALQALGVLMQAPYQVQQMQRQQKLQTEEDEWRRAQRAEWKRNTGLQEQADIDKNIALENLGLLFNPRVDVAGFKPSTIGGIAVEQARAGMAMPPAIQNILAERSKTPQTKALDKINLAIKEADLEYKKKLTKNIGKTTGKTLYTLPSGRQVSLTGYQVAQEERRRQEALNLGFTTAEYNTAINWAYKSAGNPLLWKQDFDFDAVVADKLVKVKEGVNTRVETGGVESIEPGGMAIQKRQGGVRVIDPTATNNAKEQLKKIFRDAQKSNLRSGIGTTPKSIYRADLEKNRSLYEDAGVDVDELIKYLESL